MSALLNVFGFKEGYEVELGDIEEGVFIPKEPPGWQEVPFKGVMGDVRKTAEVFVRMSHDVLGDEEFLVKPLREFSARTAEGFFEEAFSFVIRFWSSSDLATRELVLLASYMGINPVADPPEGTHIKLLGFGACGDFAFASLAPSNEDEAIALMRYFLGSGYALKALASQRGLELSFGLTRGPAYSKGGAALGAGPRVASMLSTLRLPGFVGFHAEVVD